MLLQWASTAGNRGRARRSFGRQGELRFMARFFINHRGRRTRDYTISLYESNGTTAFNVASGDRVLVKIGKNADEPDLEIDSNAATANGSSLTLTVGSNVVQMRIAENDAGAMRVGAYECEIVVIDKSEVAGQKTKHSQLGAIFFHPTMQGEPYWTESSSSSS